MGDYAMVFAPVPRLTVTVERQADIDGLHLHAGAQGIWDAHDHQLAEAGAGYVRTSVAESGNRREPGIDLAILADGYACLTPLRAVWDVSDLDLNLPD